MYDTYGGEAKIYNVQALYNSVSAADLFFLPSQKHSSKAGEGCATRSHGCE